MAARNFRLKAPKLAEHPLQKQIADVLRVEIAAPGRISRLGVVWWSADIANYAGVAGARIGRGIVAGIPDMFFSYHGRLFCIEIKTLEGVLSEEQQWLMVALCASGARVGVARSPADVLLLLDTWGIPRARRVRLAA